MPRVTRLRLRRLLRLLTPATLVGLAGLPGFANTIDEIPMAPTTVARSDLISCRLCMLSLLIDPYQDRIRFLLHLQAVQI